MRRIVHREYERPATKGQLADILRAIESQCPGASRYAPAEIVAWIRRHETNRTPRELVALFADVGWCDKEHGGVR